MSAATRFLTPSVAGYLAGFSGLTYVHESLKKKREHDRNLLGETWMRVREPFINGHALKTVSCDDTKKLHLQFTTQSPLSQACRGE